MSSLQWYCCDLRGLTVLVRRTLEKRMNEIKNAGFAPLTGIPTTDEFQNEAPISLDADLARGGRPPESGLNPFLVTWILRLYTEFIKGCAPRNQNERSLNFALFSPDIPKEEHAKRSPFNGLGKLQKRRSIPLLWQSDRISEGIFRAETTEDFQGGLQILFHPYVQLLNMPTDLNEIRELVVICASRQDLGVAHYSPFGARRNQRSFEEESLSLEKRISESKVDPVAWRQNFLPLLAVALGLTLESCATCDGERLEKWQRWWTRRHLQFSDWPVGNLATRQVLDRWVELQASELAVPYINSTLAGFSYLHSYVLGRGAGRTESGGTRAAPNTSDVKGTYNPYGLVELFLRIRDGNSPSPQDVSAIILGQASLAI